jgi:hypothetical protein
MHTMSAIHHIEHIFKVIYVADIDSFFYMIGQFFKEMERQVRDRTP